MVGRFLAVLGGIAGILAGSQAPNFTAHFMQNLEGRVDELRSFVSNVEADRERAGFTRNMAQAACAAAEPGSVKEDCQNVEDTIVRYETLLDLQDQLRDENVWKRPVVLAQRVSTDDNVRAIAENAMKEYKPAIPTTADGAGYAAGVGALLWALLRIIFMILGAPFRPRY